MPAQVYGEPEESDAESNQSAGERETPGVQDGQTESIEALLDEHTPVSEDSVQLSTEETPEKLAPASEQNGRDEHDARNDHDELEHIVLPSKDGDAETAPERVYECLDCETRVGGFPSDCPGCGSTAFKHCSDSGENRPTLTEGVISDIANATARVNPYIPR